MYKDNPLSNWALRSRPIREMPPPMSWSDQTTRRADEQASEQATKEPEETKRALARSHLAHLRPLRRAPEAFAAPPKWRLVAGGSSLAAGESGYVGYIGYVGYVGCRLLAGG